MTYVAWRNEEMLKIRLMGTPKEIRWMEKLLRRSPELIVTEFSKPYPIKGSDRHFRVYVEIIKNAEDKE